MRLLIEFKLCFIYLFVRVCVLVCVVCVCTCGCVKDWCMSWPVCGDQWELVSAYHMGPGGQFQAVQIGE